MSPAAAVGEVQVLDRVGDHLHVSIVAPGLAEAFRPGTFLSVGVPVTVHEAPSGQVLRRALPVHRTRPHAGRGGVAVTLEAVVSGATARWCAGLGVGAAVDVVGPLGRPFALPKEPVTCVLAGHGAHAATLSGLGERLRERGCVVHLLLGGDTETDLFGVLEARRSARSVTVTTRDGSLGSAGTVADALPELLRRTGAEVVYAAGPVEVLHGAALAAEEHGAWSQTAVPVPAGCGTGLCLGCVLPVVGEDGLTRMLRACVEGPVLRGDRVRWEDLS